MYDSGINDIEKLKVLRKNLINQKYSFKCPAILTKYFTDDDIEVLLSMHDKLKYFELYDSTHARIKSGNILKGKYKYLLIKKSDYVTEPFKVMGSSGIPNNIVTNTMDFFKSIIELNMIQSNLYTYSKILNNEYKHILGYDATNNK